MARKDWQCSLIQEIRQKYSKDTNTVVMAVAILKRTLSYVGGSFQKTWHLM